MVGVSAEEPPALHALPPAPKGDVDTQSLSKDSRLGCASVRTEIGS